MRRYWEAQKDDQLRGKQIFIDNIYSAAMKRNLLFSSSGRFSRISQTKRDKCTLNSFGVAPNFPMILKVWEIDTRLILKVIKEIKTSQLLTPGIFFNLNTLVSLHLTCRNTPQKKSASKGFLQQSQCVVKSMLIETMLKTKKFEQNKLERTYS